MNKINISIQHHTGVELSGTAWYTPSTIYCRMNLPYKEIILEEDRGYASKTYCIESDSSPKYPSRKMLFVNEILEQALLYHYENRDTIIKNRMLESARWNHFYTEIVPKCVGVCVCHLRSIDESRNNLKMLGQEIQHYKTVHSKNHFKRWYSEHGEEYRTRIIHWKDEIVEVTYTVRSIIHHALENEFHRTVTVSEIDRALQMVENYHCNEGKMVYDLPCVESVEMIQRNGKILTGTAYYSQTECIILINDDRGTRQIYRETVPVNFHCKFGKDSLNPRNRIFWIDPLDILTELVDFYEIHEDEINDTLEDEQLWWRRFNTEISPVFSVENNTFLTDLECIEHEIETIQRMAKSNIFFNRFRRFPIHPATIEWRDTLVETLTINKESALLTIHHRLEDLMKSNNQLVTPEKVHHAQKQLRSMRKQQIQK